MSNAGFILINDNDNVVIDSNFSNAVLVKSGSYKENETISFKANLPLMFVRYAEGYGNYKLFKVSNNAFRANFIWGGGEYFIFDIVPPDINKTNSGLQIFNENGLMVFNSNAYYCRIVDNYIFPEIDIRNYWASTGGHEFKKIYDHLIPATRTGKIAIMNTFGSRGYQDDPEYSYLFCPIYYVNRNLIRMQCAIYELVNGSGTGNNENNIVITADVGDLPNPYDVYAGI